MEGKARRDPQRPQDSGQESNRAILPLLQPPVHQQAHRVTNFYIDNILRPDFGRKRKDGTLVRDGGSLAVILRREEQTGRKSRTGNAPQRGAGGEEEQDETGESDQQDPDTVAERPELRAGRRRSRAGGRPARPPPPSRCCGRPGFIVPATQTARQQGPDPANQRRP
ncbi:hypothetical protein KUCAC02_019177 [Chaenocephalus aceratus]|uniref:Uncharacterized protein n=1 Tax=Chaenocephalus aceratus TaxID=36190 RepID=A0ACB9WBJ6_CHAAC|nr:hypothetical protein KUCAC02_019177 [Chaenocephalus aceratus]